jgi:antitoxin (DNA-binding transcriptional repressor) of toxin-antitoxin stability system
MFTLKKPRPRSAQAPRTVSLTDLKLHTGRLVRSAARGRTLKVTHRRRALSRLIPVGVPSGRPVANDPLFRLADFAEPMGVLTNEKIDQAIYGL